MPGEFFDVNPGKRRAARAGRFGQHVRFSFGPPRESVTAGVDRLEQMVRDAAAGKVALAADEEKPAGRIR